MNRTAATRVPTLGTMLRRGLVRRCAWCGDRHAFFHAWLLKRDRCQACGIRWDRGTDGQELGAVVINLIFTVAIVLVGMIVTLVVTYPDVPALGLAIVTVLGAVVAYTFVYPIGFTVYHAIDLRIRRPLDDELAEAAAAVSGTATPGA